MFGFFRRKKKDAEVTTDPAVPSPAAEPAASDPAAPEAQPTHDTAAVHADAPMASADAPAESPPAIAATPAQPAPQMPPAPAIDTAPQPGAQMPGSAGGAPAATGASAQPAAATAPASAMKPAASSDGHAPAPVAPQAAASADPIPGATHPDTVAVPGWTPRAARGGLPSRFRARPAAPQTEAAPSAPAAPQGETAAQGTPVVPQRESPAPGTPAIEMGATGPQRPAGAAPDAAGSAVPVEPAAKVQDVVAPSAQVQRVVAPAAAARPEARATPPAAPAPASPELAQPQPAAPQVVADAKPVPAPSEAVRPGETKPIATPPAEPIAAVSPATDDAASSERVSVGRDSYIVPTQADEAPQEAERLARAGWLARLRGGLARTRSQISAIFSRSKIDESLYEELETALLASDTGYGTTEWLLTELRDRAKRDRIQDAATLKAALTQILTELLTPLEQPIQVDRAEPLVMMITGVNGAGKTTSIGKLARHLHQIEQSVLLAAGDTFRAAAREQLARWGERNQVQVIASEGGDPAAVAFDSVKAGQARKVDVVMIDTAGRLPTQRHLMDELKKVRRVIGKAMPDAPHEVLLVLDGNTGQNMLAQVQAFDEAVQLTGLIVTKLDGTAKGGAIAALAHTRRDRPLPVYFIGVGEGVEDLQAFSAQEFASALLH